MIGATRNKISELTSYEEEQIQRIAEWKSEPPHPFSEFWKRISLPAARVAERLIPDSLVSSAVQKSYDASTLIAAREEIRRRAGVDNLEDLRHGPLERCDALAAGVKVSAERVSALEGAATGVAGFLTSLLDVPLLFTHSLGTIRRVGHCYGYPLDHRRGRHFVLGVLIAAMSGMLELRRQRVRQLHELEDLLVEEIQEEVLTEEALSFVFQIEVFEGVPGIGLASGAALNWLFMRRVAETARMVFAERWLRDNGKIDTIEPADVHQRLLAGGWSGLIGRAVYSGCYGVGFGVALPVCAIVSWIRPMDNAMLRGMRDGVFQADLLAGRVSGTLERAATRPELGAPARS